MEEKEATRTCSQCHKDVAELNFALHESHCRRFLCLCPDCGEPVPRENLVQHREEQHTKVRCSRCNQRMERCQLTDHQSNECIERLQSCNFCEILLPWKHMEDHRSACGSRTELCRECGRYVTLKDQNQHRSTCPGTASGPPPATSNPPATTTKMNGRRCEDSPPAEEFEEHQLRCDDDEEEDSSGPDPDHIRICPHCYLALPAPTLRWHQEKCQILIGLK